MYEELVSFGNFQHTSRHVYEVKICLSLPVCAYRDDVLFTPYTLHTRHRCGPPFYVRIVTLSAAPIVAAWPLVALLPALLLLSLLLPFRKVGETRPGLLSQLPAETPHIRDKLLCTPPPPPPPQYHLCFMLMIIKKYALLININIS